MDETFQSNKFFLGDIEFDLNDREEASVLDKITKNGKDVNFPPITV